MKPRYLLLALGAILLGTLLLGTSCVDLAEAAPLAEAGGGGLRSLFVTLFGLAA